MEATHHSFWMAALKEHKYKTEEMISYKEASLRTSHAARMGALQDALRNNSGKKAYVQMIEREIRCPIKWISVGPERESIILRG